MQHSRRHLTGLVRLVRPLLDTSLAGKCSKCGRECSKVSPLTGLHMPTCRVAAGGAAGCSRGTGGRLLTAETSGGLQGCGGLRTCYCLSHCTGCGRLFVLRACYTGPLWEPAHAQPVLRLAPVQALSAGAGQAGWLPRHWSAAAAQQARPFVQASRGGRLAQ